MNNVLFFSSILPYTQYDYYKKNSIGAISNANDNLQRLLLEGFHLNNCNVTCINVPNIGAFPSKFKKMKTTGFPLDVVSDAKGHNIGFLNLNFIKHIAIKNNIQRHISGLIDLNHFNTIFVYDLYAPFLQVLEVIKKKNPKCKVVVMIPDIIGFTNSNTSFIHRLFESWNKNVFGKGLDFIDGFVYLTEHMPEVLPQKARNIPSTIVEGIYKDNDTNGINSGKNLTKRFMLYSGSLDLRHGILNLVDAFITAEVKNLDLYICGDGDGKEVVLEKIKLQSNIKYLGQLDRKDVLKLQKQAYLLINPRNSSGEFTKYSFPSKIMEYLGSGTPTFMYQLQGIPPEYFKYCYSLQDESTEALSNFIKNISEKDYQEMDLMGSNARSFILDKKDPQKQVKKIIDLIKTL